MFKISEEQDKKTNITLSRGNIIAGVAVLLATVLIAFLIEVYEIYPFNYTYEETEAGLIVHEGLFLTTSYEVNSEDASELGISLITYNIDQLRGSAFVFYSIVPITVMLIIKIFQGKIAVLPKTRADINDLMLAVVPVFLIGSVFLYMFIRNYRYVQSILDTFV
ncbi:hypothetical protein [Evansella clarkii]|uniref:hypothetical protein n=1 Tax=Evansella clarkii TaxID=79879 RepID=UPI000B44A2F6|nr:hypothetical protein [Evansella clarkii]